MKIFSGSIKGSRHEKNEDSLFISKDFDKYKMLMVMDGISACKNASKLTNRCKDYLEGLSDKELRSKIEEMYYFKSLDIIRMFSTFTYELSSGSTLSIALLNTEKKVVRTFNMGDSPIFLIRNNKLYPVYGDCSYPMYRLREYSEMKTITVGENELYIIKPNEEMESIKKIKSGVESSEMGNMVMSSLPLRQHFSKIHIFSFQYKPEDVILMGTDGFVSCYLYDEFEKNYVEMVQQIKLGGQSVFDNFIKVNSYLTGDDSTGICAYL